MRPISKNSSALYMRPRAGRHRNRRRRHRRRHHRPWHFRTIGKGGGGGNGSGYGRGAGGLGGRRARAPDVIPGQANVRGSLDKEIIRRIIRRHINEVKYCYETELTKKADLSGRVSVQFTIAATGQVIASVLQSSTMSNIRVENCVVQAVGAGSSPSRCDLLGQASHVRSVDGADLLRRERLDGTGAATSDQAGGLEPGGDGARAARVLRMSTGVVRQEQRVSEQQRHGRRPSVRARWVFYLTRRFVAIVAKKGLFLCRMIRKGGGKR